MDADDLTLELRSYSSETLAHSHDYHQLVLPVMGELNLSVGGCGGEVSLRQAAVVAAGRMHECTAPEQNCFVVANVPEALAPQLERLPAFVPVDGALAHYIAFLHHTLIRDGGSARCERQMLLLLLQLLQERFGEPVNVDRRIRAARAYLDQHFDQAVSLAQLAAAAHVSPRQLGELFRRQLGMTPHQYLIEKRMQVAWRLLEAGELSVQQVAERTGYGSLSAFSDRFHKHFGHAPRHFRQIAK